MKLKINKKRINEIVSETIEKLVESIIKENNDIVTSGEISSNLFNGEVGRIEVIERDNFNEWAEQVWAMFVNSYSEIGGVKSYRHYEDFCKKHPLLIIVLDNDNNLLACSSYRSTGRNDLKNDCYWMHSR